MQPNDPPHQCRPKCPACVAAYRRTDTYRMRNAAQKRLDRSRWTPEQKQASLQRLLDRKARGG